MTLPTVTYTGPADALADSLSTGATASRRLS